MFFFKEENEIWHMHILQNKKPKYIKKNINQIFHLILKKFEFQISHHFFIF